jgi:tetratricopeptide (TPR) repeat protein
VAYDLRMPETWSERVDAFWRRASDDEPERTLAEMQQLVAERPEGDAEALYEWASVHDFLDREPEAIPIYRSALEVGLPEPKRRQAVIQLASSLRNVGASAEAVALLRELDPDPVTAPGAQAFLALALHDLGDHTDALRTALLALAPMLPQYGRAVENYARALTKPEGPMSSAPDHRSSQP